MLKRSVALIIASILLLTSFAVFASGNKEQGNASATVDTSNTETTKTGFANTITIHQARGAKEFTPCTTTIRQDLLKEKLNIVLEIEEIPQNDFQQKMRMLFAAGKGPDMIAAIRMEGGLFEFTDEGFFKGLTKEEVARLLPNYRNIWTDAEWDTIFNIYKFSDNKIYNFPGKRSQLINMTWLYRKDIFDKYNLSFPKTPDEFMSVSKFLKEKEGKEPMACFGTVGKNVMYAFSWAMQMYGMPDLSPKWLSYQDPANKEFVPYIYSDKRAREAAKFINRYYGSDFVWREFATATQEQANKYRSQGHGFIVWGYPHKDTEYESYAKDVYPNVDWVWSKDFPSAYPDKTYYKKEPLASEGPSINSELSGEKLERVLAMINWECSEEGILFGTFGKEGVTAQRKNDRWMLADNILSPLNPKGEKFMSYIWALPGGGSVFPHPHPDYDLVYNPVKVVVTEHFNSKKNYYGHIEPLFSYQGDEVSTIASLTASLKPITDEYYLKFATGKLDPAKDEDWNQYLDALRKVGIDEFKKIRTDAFNRANNK